MKQDFLEKKVEFSLPARGEIINNIEIAETEPHHTGEVFIYWPKIYPGWKGLLFPNDDIIEIGKHYDVIVNNTSNKPLIFSEVYHNPKNILGKELLVIISGISSKGHPMFKLSGYRGFVIKGKANIGAKVRVKVFKAIAGNKIEDFLKTELVSYLE